MTKKTKKELTYSTVCLAFLHITKMVAEKSNSDPFEMKVMDVFEWMVGNNYVEHDFPIKAKVTCE